LETQINGSFDFGIAGKSKTLESQSMGGLPPLLKDREKARVSK